MQRRIDGLFTEENRPFSLKEIKARLHGREATDTLRGIPGNRPETEKPLHSEIKDRSLHYALNALIRDGLAQKVVFMTPDKPGIGYAKRTDVDTLVAVDGKRLMEDYHVRVSFGVCPRELKGPYDLHELGDQVLMVHMNRIRP